MATPLQPMPIIVGAPRSGTTLLRFVLDAHPDLAIPPETGFLALGPELSGTSDVVRRKFYETVINFPPDAPAWSDFQISKELFWAQLSEIEPFTVSDGFRTFYRLYASRFDKKRWGDKTPVHCFGMKSIEETLPEAHFLHLIRDGRDVCLSSRQMWFSPGWEVEKQARRWCDFVSSARQQGATCRHYMEIKYEDLVLAPRQSVQRICRFLALRYDEKMLEFHARAAARLEEHGTRLQTDGSVLVTREQRLRAQQSTTRPFDQTRALAWKSAMGAKEREQFDAIAGPLLSALGYETSHAS